MAIATTAIATSIAGLSVTGLTIKDLDGFKDKLEHRDCPILIPAPQYFTDPNIKYETYGTGATALITVYYTLNYRLFYAEAGTGRKISDHYQGMVGMTVDIMDAIIANDATSDAIHLSIAGVGVFGIVTDPSDKPFFGVDIGIRVMEYQN